MSLVSGAELSGHSWFVQEATETLDEKAACFGDVDASAEAEELATEAMGEVLEVIREGKEAGDFLKKMGPNFFVGTFWKIRLKYTEAKISGQTWWKGAVNVWILTIELLNLDKNTSSWMCSSISMSWYDGSR